MDKIIKEVKTNVYGNKLITLILPLNIHESIEENENLRGEFVKSYKSKCDSLILLSKKEDYHFKVFEPNSGKKGSFSIMCGNGLRAAAIAVEENKINLQTGWIFNNTRGFGNNYRKPW